MKGRFMETLFTDEKWQVISAKKMNELFYARHDCQLPGDRAWMCFWQRNCTDCEERVPDNIQTILRLLVGLETQSEKV